MSFLDDGDDDDDSSSARSTTAADSFVINVKNALDDENNKAPLLSDVSLSDAPVAPAKKTFSLLQTDKSYAGMAKVAGSSEQLPRLSAAAISKRLMRLAKTEWRLLSLATVALVVSSVSSMAIPTYVGQLIDSVAPSTSTGDPGHSLAVACGYMAFWMTVSALFSFLRNLCFTLAGERVVTRLRKTLYNALLQQEIGFFDQNKSGELVNRLSSDSQIIQNAASVNLSMALRFSGQLIAGVVFLFTISWKLTLVMLSVVPIIVAGGWFYGRFVRKISKDVQDALARSGDTATETLSSIRTVRSFSADRLECDKYAVCIDESYRLAAKRAWANGIFVGAAAWLGSLAILLVLWYGGTLVISGELTSGTLTSFVLYTLTVSFALGGLMELVSDFMKAIGASERVFQLIDREPKLKREGGDVLGDVRGEIDVDHVEFAYPTRPDNPVLSNFSLRLRPGKVVALVGASGGGKSTIVSLLLRFYAADKGRITLDGRDISALDASHYRRHFAVVSQEPTLFCTTIAENIAYAMPNATDEQIIAAAKVANAHDFISNFEDGYKTVVGERGIKLSGGQKQRIAIARAVLRDPRVLLLDEATAALDANSEHEVKIALDRLMVGRTVMVIAHRLSTVIGADQVCVIDQGRVAQAGSHKELMQDANGLYATLVSRQLKQD
jgi:ATP-binding cassette subfamily B protein